MKSAPDPINRFQLRQASLAQTPLWQQFCTAAGELVRNHTYRSSELDHMPLTSIPLETQLRELCIRWFPCVPRSRPDSIVLHSISSRMWQARRLAKQCQSVDLKTLFNFWHHFSQYSTTHREIKKMSRLHKRQRLEHFLQDSVDLALTNRAFDWHRRIRQLSPKHPFRRIQLYDDKGHPLSPGLELTKIVDYFGVLIRDSDLILPPRPALQALPFTETELLEGFCKLPATKAPAPNGVPAIVWRAIAHDVTPILYRSLHDHCCRQIHCHLNTGPPGGFIF